MGKVVATSCPIARQIRVKSVLADKGPIHLPQHGCPEETNAVGYGQPAHVAVSVGVDGQICAVTSRPDT